MKHEIMEPPTDRAASMQRGCSGAMIAVEVAQVEEGEKGTADAAA